MTGLWTACVRAHVELQRARRAYIEQPAGSPERALQGAVETARREREAAIAEAVRAGVVSSRSEAMERLHLGRPL